MIMYQYPTFDSMIDSGKDWATLFDWSEAMCYAMLRAQITGYKYKIKSSCINKGAWHVSETRKSAPCAGITQVVRVPATPN